MCGIGGISTDHVFTRAECEIAHRLLTSLVRRGEDAWGYFDGRKVYKEPGSFLESPKYDTLVDNLYGAETNVFLCHTRRAVVGDPAVAKNNHPWNELEPLVFAHNGIISYADEFDNVWEVETDSFWLYYWIWEEYKKWILIPRAIDEGVDHVRGTYACWLHHKGEETTYLFRMGNPIVGVSYHTDAGITIFGSDPLSWLTRWSCRGKS